MQGSNAAKRDRRAASLDGETADRVHYANFCRVTGSPEELMLDFAIVAQPMAAAGDDVATERRIVMTPFTAKRMLGALNAAIGHYERTFGPIETDARNRVRRAPRGTTGIRPRVEPISSPEAAAGDVGASAPNAVAAEADIVAN